MRLIAFLAAVLLPAGIACAAEFIPLEDECHGRQIMIRGAIEPGDYDRFVDRMARLVTSEKLPAVQEADMLWTLRLDSPGGDLAEAMRIGRFLRRALATTDVSYRFAQRPDGVYDFERTAEVICLEGDGRLSGCFPDLVPAECTGACLLIWLSGAERYAHGGKLGLHGLAGSDPAVREYLGELVVPQPWITRMLAETASGSGWLTWSESNALSVRATALTELLAGCPAPLTSEESFQSVAAPSQQVRDNLMDRADAHRACRQDRVADARGALVASLQRRRL